MSLKLIYEHSTLTVRVMCAFACWRNGQTRCTCIYSLLYVTGKEVGFDPLNCELSFSLNKT